MVQQKNSATNTQIKQEDPDHLRNDLAISVENDQQWTPVEETKFINSILQQLPSSPYFNYRESFLDIDWDKVDSHRSIAESQQYLEEIIRMVQKLRTLSAILNARLRVHGGTVEDQVVNASSPSRGTSITSAPSTSITSAPSTSITSAPSTSITSAPSTSITSAPSTCITKATSTVGASYIYVTENRRRKYINQDYFESTEKRFGATQNDWKVENVSDDVE